MPTTLTDFKEMLEGAADPASESASLDPPIVLIVDDDDGVRQSLELLLSDHFRVIASGSASAGVMAFNHDVCAVVLDVKMSDKDGFWVCDEIRKLEPDVPVIFYSAYQNLKDPFEVINSHRPFAYIAKDSDCGKLLDALDSATRIYRSKLQSRRIIANLGTSPLDVDDASQD